MGLVPGVRSASCAGPQLTTVPDRFSPGWMALGGWRFRSSRVGRN
jgi:hypothetical protein